MFEAVPLFDVDHIEVLRGPQGALYGKNATGGAINIVDTKPGFDVSGYARVSYGTFNRRESEGAVQAPIVSDKSAVRLAYTYVKNDGTIKNLYPGTGDVEQTDVFALRGTLLVKPVDDLELVIRYIHSRSGGRNSGVYADNINFAAAGFPRTGRGAGKPSPGAGVLPEQPELHTATATLRATG